jgi:hypothetical protein
VPGTSEVATSFGVTGLRTNLVRLAGPGTPVSPPNLSTQLPPFPLTQAFFQDGNNLVQLTNFRRTDTFTGS